MRLPSLRRIADQDVPDAPSWLKYVTTPINNFFQVVYGVLTNGITFQDNVKADILTLDVNNAQFPLSIPLTNKVQKVTGVFVVQILPAPLSSAQVIWQQVGTDLQVLDILGLDAAEAYSVRIIVI